MEKFKYTVLNPENKSLQGTISSVDKESARKELNQLGFSVLSLESIQESETESELDTPIFEFSGTNKSGQKVTGTIQSEDKYNAFLRLINEYSLVVDYIVKNDLTEEQKKREIAKGSYKLYTKYEEEKQKDKKKDTDEKDLLEFEQKHEQLKAQIQYLIEKITKILNEYEDIIKPESKKKIKEHLEKILRIRHSTNLDYTRKEAEDLLTFLQKEELLLQENERIKERTKIIIEAQNIMSQIKKTRPTKNINITESLKGWYEKNITENESPNTINKILGYIISPLIFSEYDTPKILELKQKLSENSIEIKEFAISSIKTSSKEYREETIKSIKRSLQTRKKLKKELKEEIKKTKQTLKKQGKKTIIEKIIKELYSFSGWLLTFYLLYYFISIYAVSKELGITQTPYFFYIYKSTFLKYFLSTLFIFHSGLSLKLNIFKNNKIATIAIPPILIFSIFLIYFNL